MDLNHYTESLYLQINLLTKKMTQHILTFTFEVLFVISSVSLFLSFVSLAIKETKVEQSTITPAQNFDAGIKEIMATEPEIWITKEKVKYPVFTSTETLNFSEMTGTLLKAHIKADKELRLAIEALLDKNKPYYKARVGELKEAFAQHISRSLGS